MKSIIRNNKDRNKFVEFVLAKDIKVAHRVEFTKIQRPRTISQNSYLWLILTCVQEQSYTDRYDFSISKDDAYLIALNRYPVCKEINWGGTIRLIEITSSYFDVKQMSNFIKNLKRFFKMEGFEIPDANTQKMWEVYNDYLERGIL